MKTFYEFVEEWWKNCGSCPHCGSSYPFDEGGHWHGYDECPNSPNDYHKEVVEAYIFEEAWNEPYGYTRA